MVLRPRCGRRFRPRDVAVAGGARGRRGDEPRARSCPPQPAVPRTAARARRRTAAGAAERGSVGSRTLIVAGRGCPREAVTWGSPVLGDARSGLGGHPVVIAHADPILRSPIAAEALRPHAVYRLGDPPASRVVNEWLASSGARETVVASSWIDPAHTAAEVAREVAAPSDGDEAWLAR